MSHFKQFCTSFYILECDAIEIQYVLFEMLAHDSILLNIENQLIKNLAIKFCLWSECDKLLH